MDSVFVDQKRRANNRLMERLKNTKIFKNEYSEFVPSEWISIDGISRPVLFKVVTHDLKSLGLRKNPNIMTFSENVWSTSNTNPKSGNSDVGGIWSALKFSGAKTLSKYMESHYSLKTRIFKAAADTPLYANSYRVKSAGIYLFEEV